MLLIDTHTHHLRRNAIVDIDPVDIRSAIPALRAGYHYSVGIHPWNCTKVSSRDLLMLRAIAIEPQVIAIGETGLDTTRTDTSTLSGDNSLLQLQTRLLKLHIALSEELHKPLILHIVRRFPEIIRLRRDIHPSQPWIIHGFRGKPQLANELLRHGFHLSYGEKFNPASLAITPSDRLLIETDQSPRPITTLSRNLPTHLHDRPHIGDTFIC